MTANEIADLAFQAKTQGLDRCVLKMKAPQFRGKFPETVRTPFGLCKWYPANTDAEVIIFPTLIQIEKWLRKSLKAYEELESHANSGGGEK